MGDLACGFHGDRQGPEELIARHAFLGPEDPDQSDQSGQGGGKSNPHPNHNHDQQDDGNCNSDIDAAHLFDPFSSSSKPETVSASRAATVLASSIMGTATGSFVPRIKAAP